MKKRIGIVAGVKNEGEVMEQFITHHLRLGFAKIFILDITSTDGTKEILERYVNHPQIHVEFSKAIDGTPHLHRQFRLKAYLDEDIDHIFYMDPDEFVVMEPKSNLDDIFGQIESNCYEIPRYNLVNPQAIRHGVSDKVLKNLHKLYYHTPRVRYNYPLPCPSFAWRMAVTQPIPPKVLTTKTPVQISFGGHHAVGEAITQVVIPAGIFIAHIPVSTLSRMTFKLKTRYAYFKKNPDWFKKFLVRYHQYCYAYELGLTEKMYENLFFSPEEIKLSIELGEITKAKRLLPQFSSVISEFAPPQYSRFYELSVESAKMAQITND